MAARPRARNIGSASDYLERICEHIRLDLRRYRIAAREYERAAEFLSADAALESLDLRIIPQGSIKTRTATRPFSAEGDTVPFDLDVACSVGVDPMRRSSKSVYDLVKRRLQESPEYKRRLSVEPKCLRLEFDEHDFHVDLVPACPDPSDPERTRLLIADRSLWDAEPAPIKTWRATDPVRFANWFDERARVRVPAETMFSREAQVEALPEHDEVVLSAPLRSVTVLLKRRRDIEFLGEKSRPSSLLLATLAARHYHGEPELAVSLTDILDGILGDIDRQGGRLLAVKSQFDPPEDLTAALSDDARERLVKMFRTMRATVGSLSQTGVAPRSVPEALTALAGRATAESVSKSVQQAMQRANVAGMLGVASADQMLKEVPRDVRVRGVEPVRPHAFHRDN